MGGFSAPALHIVRIAFIGIGELGRTHIDHLSLIDGVEIVGVCDIDQEQVAKIVASLANKTGKCPASYCLGHRDYRRMLLELRPDAVFIYAPCDYRAEIAAESMKSGAHVFVEAPLAITLNELWHIIDTSEHTCQHCMMLEPNIYGREELMFLNMTRQGILGSILHGEVQGNYRQSTLRKRGVPAVSPIAQQMNIARTDDIFSRIVAFGTLTDAPHHICSSLIKTNLGRTILIEWDKPTPP